MEKVVAVNIKKPSMIRGLHAAARSVQGKSKLVFFTYSDSDDAICRIKGDSKEILGASNCKDITFLNIQDMSLHEALTARNMELGIYLGEDPDRIKMNRSERAAQSSPKINYFHCIRHICEKCESIHHEETLPITRERYWQLANRDGLPPSEIGKKHIAYDVTVDGKCRTC